MNRQIEQIDNENLGAGRTGLLIRSVYYAVIVGLGVLLFTAVYLAR